jgi:cobalt/nickel transport system permease protein
MADALISPAVGGVFWAASALLTIRCSSVLKRSDGEDKTAMMGVLSAFVFAAQMINFSIPGTGSSGHIGGALLLAVFLGPGRAFLSMVSILTVQALFFADGGLLALGCNVFNMGFFPCFIAYPLIYKPITERIGGRRGVFAGSVLASVAGLEMGAFCVVAEMLASDMTSLPAGLFFSLMMGIHLAIGAVEGMATAMIIAYVMANAPDELPGNGAAGFGARALFFFALMAALLGSVAAWYASADPDGLEWSIDKIKDVPGLLLHKTGLHSFLYSVQENVAFLPDYSFKDAGVPGRLGTSVSGVLGSLFALLCAAACGKILKRRKRRAR